MSILYPEQKPIADDISRNIDKCELYNIPTGRGKTFILLDVAIKSFKEGHNVIISVSNNYLVREMFRAAQEYFNKDNEYPIDIRIGRDNYIDPVKLKSLHEDKTLFKYCEENSLDKFIESFVEDDENQDVFFDEFNEMVEYKDIAYAGIVKKLVGKSEYGGVEISGITITNHYYLLSKSLHSKDFDIGEYTLLVDEVHEMGEVFMQINTDSFSFFEYRNMVMQVKDQVLELEDFRGKIRLIDSLKKQSVRAYKIMEKYIDSDKVGTYTSKGEEVNPVRKDAAQLLSRKENDVVVKNSKSLNLQTEYFNKVCSFKVRFEVEESKSNHISRGLYYSPSRGYPTLSVSAQNPLGKMNGLFWKKVKRFAGVSGSVTSSFNPAEDELRYGYARIGYLRKNDTRKIHFYDRMFERKNVQIHLVDRKFYEGISMDSVYKEDFDPIKSPYYNKIIEEIHLKHNGKNSMIICGGYKEAAYLAELYRLKYNDRIIHTSIPTEKPLTTLGKFKKNGGIFFATKNYATGTSLEGKELENLFIIKFPYPDYTAKFWQELKEKGPGMYFKNMHREMLVSLMQTLGRLARTKDDLGNIYILDYNFTVKSRDKRDVKKIIETYGIIQKVKNKIKRAVKKEEMDSLFN